MVTRGEALRDVAAIVRSPSMTAQAYDRATALVREHGLRPDEVDAAPARVVTLAEVTTTDRMVTVEVDGTVVRSRVTAVEDAGRRRVVRYGARGLSSVNGLPTHTVLIEREEAGA